MIQLADEIVIDGNGLVIGRLCAVCAKKLLSGYSVVVVNAEKAVFSGDLTDIAKDYRARRGIQDKSNPSHSVKWPRRPDLLFRKILSGMLPRSRRITSLRRFRAYLGVPKEFEGKAKKTDIKASTALQYEAVPLGDVCAKL
ncbi:50S ribosomal protein L13 [Candidatus Micrarchaeota archaeon CG08_land_8_20_14_0_20_59_11]|nr:MAG: 50S ribosomal protein L13 [Candidatus Micrarchaeota archaeon CG08_land_8_20_14_0_20_59_11]